MQYGFVLIRYTLNLSDGEVPPYILALGAELND